MTYTATLAVPDRPIAWARPDILAALDDQQREAVLAVTGPVLITAGAGSGKTRVLISRIAHLILNLGVDPDAILGITFTRKAADEMRERLAQTLGHEAASRVSLLTFHSLGLDLLRQYGGPLGLDGRFGISDEHDSGMRIRAALRTLGIPRAAPGETPAEVQERISQAKSLFADQVARAVSHGQADAFDVIEIYRSGRGEVWRTIGNTLGAPDADRFAAQYEAYQASLLRDQCVDFDDLVALPLLLFLQRPEIGRLVAARWHFILVDEYQDTDYVQDHLLRILIQHYGNLCVVGDAAQAIYSWRQAKLENFLTFPERYPACTTITLDRNYRSTPDILQVANAVLANRPEIANIRRTQLWTSAPPGALPRVWVCSSQEAEAEAIAEDIKRALASGEIDSYSDVMILYRLNALARAVEISLQRHCIPYRIVNGRTLLERKEIRDVLAFARIAENPFDQLNFERAVNAYANGVGPSTIEALKSFARVTGRDLVSVAQEADDRLGIRPQHQRALREVGNLIQQVREVADREGAAAALRFVLQETEIQIDLMKAAAEAEGEDDEEELRRLERKLFDIEDFLLYVEELDRSVRRADGRKLTIQELLDAISLVRPGDATEEISSDEPMVSLMTIHAAKGLEARRVYVVGLEERVLPASGAVLGDMLSDDGTVDGRLAEEARLFYVAITRAREHLILSASRTRELVRNEPQPMIRSRFLAALPEMGYRLEIQR